VRKISKLSGGPTLIVSLPKGLLERSRQIEGQPFRWSAGDHVLIALSHDGQIIIRYPDGMQERGNLVVEGVRGGPLGGGVYHTRKKYSRYRNAVLTRKTARQLREESEFSTGQAYARLVANGLGVAPGKLEWKDELKFFRSQMGMITQRRASGFVGVTNVRWSEWESGKSKPGKEKREMYRGRMKLLIDDKAVRENPEVANAKRRKKANE
jgi:hypothetical protein